MTKVGRGFAAVAVLCASVPSTLAGDATAELLTAPRVLRYVRIDASGKTLKYSVDDNTSPKAFGEGSTTTLVASDQIDFVLSKYNPFKVEVSVADTEEVDPSVKAITSFLDTLAKTFEPGKGAAAPGGRGTAGGGTEAAGCPDLERVRLEIASFQTQIASATLGDEVLPGWVKDATGRAGVRAVAARMFTTRNSQLGFLKEAEAVLSRIKGIRTPASDSGTQEASDARQKAEAAAAVLRQANEAREKAKTDVADLDMKSANPNVSQEARATAGRLLVAARARVQEAEKSLSEAEKAAAAARATAGCESDVSSLLALFYLAEPQRQVDSVRRLIDAEENLQKQLAALAEDDNEWFPPANRPWAQGVVGSGPNNEKSEDLVFHRRDVKSGKISIVTIKVNDVAYSAPFGVSLARATVPGSERQAVVRLREFQRWAPEVAAGIVTTSVRTPVYGVGKDAAGKDVVTKAGVTDYDVKGALLANLVCRCGGKVAYPLFQVGVVPNSDAPGLLFGVGVRFLPKPLSLSGGAIVAWAKDLDKLQVGSPVTGDADIKADLKAHPTVKAYIALQLSF